MKLQPEEAVAIGFVEEIRLRVPRLAPFLIHLTNDRRVTPGKRGLVTHALKLRMGWRKGVADYLLAQPAGGFGGLFLELKAPGGRLEHEQAEFLADMHSAGFAACAAWGTSAAVTAVTSYLAKEPGFVYSVIGFPDRPAGARGWLVLSDLTLTGTPRKR